MRNIPHNQAKKRKGENRMKKRLLSLALALALCLGLSVPTMAAGEKKTLDVIGRGLTITFDGYLREEYRQYPDGETQGAGLTDFLPIQVVADDSAVTITAAEGRKYGNTQADRDAFEADGITARGTYAWSRGLNSYWDCEKNLLFDSGFKEDAHPLEGPVTYTVSPTQGNQLDLTAPYGPTILCESDFARMISNTGQEPLASNWAKEALTNAYDVMLFPRELNPYHVDCTRGMSRAEFAAVTVNLYRAMGGRLDGVSDAHPFTDAGSDSEVGFAYNLGFVGGTSAATFSPDSTLTREQAAVMLSKVYARLRGDIPQADATSFADDASVSSWAKSAVAFMAEKGFVNGVGDNQFAPQKTLSIQEAVVIAQGMLEKLK